VVTSEFDLEALTAESLGARLRELRTGAGVSLRAQAGRLGISPSAVSQIERGIMRPSVSRLIAYVGAIGVPLASVFETGIEKAPEGSAGERAAAQDAAAAESGQPGTGQHRPGQFQFAIRRSWEVAPLLLGGGVTFRRLAPVPTPGVEFFESVYPPNSMSNAHGELLRHEGYEVGTITAGELTVDFDTDVVTLAAGDSITYPCSRPHLIANRSATVTAVATWLIVNP
jgi:transcriptional regulator with XRE-family HTH domain